jgi:hypothetical protein
MLVGVAAFTCAAALTHVAAFTSADGAAGVVDLVKSRLILLGNRRSRLVRLLGDHVRRLSPYNLSFPSFIIYIIGRCLASAIN